MVLSIVHDLKEDSRQESAPEAGSRSSFSQATYAPAHPNLSPTTPAFAPRGPYDPTPTTLSEISPLTPGVWECYKAICKSVSGTPAGAGILFPASSNVGLSKEEKASVAAHHEMFKMFKVIVQLCIMASEQYPEAVEALEDIAYAGLARMCNQVRARDNTWMKKALLSEALSTFHTLKSSTISAANQERFFHAMQYAVLKQQASKLAMKPGTLWSSHQSQPSSNDNNRLKGKYSHNNRNNNNNNNSNTNNKNNASISPGASSSANRD